MWGEDAMHDIINDDSTVDGAYTQVEGKTIIKEEEKEVAEEGGEYEEDDEPVVAAAPMPAVKGKKNAMPKKGEGC
jgi:hypothetical protein